MPDSSEEVNDVEPQAEAEVNKEQKELSSKLEEVTPKGFGLRVVSMPTAEEIKKKQEEETEQEYSSDDPDKAKGQSSKKRMSGLASLVSGKRPTINRSKMINEEKSENELKSYGALSNLGTPIYTQVKRKKVYTGQSAQTQITEVKSSKRVIHIHDGVTMEDLAQKTCQKFDKFSINVLS